MALPRSSTASEPPSPSLLEDDIPILYEDEEENDMGEANVHAWVISTLYFCLPACLRNRHPGLQVFQNMNCYYLPTGRASRKTGRKPNFAADIMIVHSSAPMQFDSTSYTIGKDGPAPKLVLEVLSEETFETRDLKDKLVLYRKLGIPEYVIVDLTGRFLPQKLELRRLQANGQWKNFKDAAGGVSSQLGFRLYIDETDPFGLHIVDTATGEQVIRPHELVEQLRQADEQVQQANERARAEAEAHRLAEERLQAEILRLRSKSK
jgi:Uma2 family endonuclease